MPLPLPPPKSAEPDHPHSHPLAQSQHQQQQHQHQQQHHQQQLPYSGYSQTADPNAAASSQHYSHYPGGYSYPTNVAPPYDSMYPQYDAAAYAPSLFHGHSAFHRPEPLPAPAAGPDLPAASAYGSHYPTAPQSTPYPLGQPGAASHQMYPPQSYPAQTPPLGNYAISGISGQNMNPYPGYGSQPLPYGQFGGGYPPAPSAQSPYNSRPMYPSPDYSSGYGAPGYPPYPPHPPQPAANQWGQ